MKKKLLFIAFFLAVFDAWAQKKPEINSYIDSTADSIIDHPFKFKGIYRTIKDSS